MTKLASPEKPVPVQDDRILFQTRLVLIVVVPFLLLAFLILYFFPVLSGEHFAWEIRPSMTARFIGAGYLSGAYLFLYTIFGRRWHRIKAAFPPVTTFTVAMLLATVLHWDRFDLSHFPFQLWLIFYIITPFLVPYLWIKNRSTESETSERNDVPVPAWVRSIFLVSGVIGIAITLFMFITPQTMIPIWPWALTPLTARVLGGWFAFLGIGGLYISRDPRWSAWRVPMQSITFWGILILIGAFMNPQDFTAGLWNPFTIGTATVILSLLVFQVWMETQRMRRV
jgi:hypothetical protein